MAWQYSDPLNGALLAAQKNSQSDIGLNSQFQPFYSSYEPLVSRYQPTTTTIINRQPASINIFDDIDDFDLEVETDNILTSARYKVPNTIYKQPSYIPSYFSKASNDFDSQGDTYKNAINTRSLNLDSPFKAKDSPNPYSSVFKPIPFDLRSTPPSSFKSDNSYPPSVNSSDPNNHNSHHQRFVQYQHRILQDKGESLSELENLKLKQKQDRLQILNTMNNNNNINQNKYQPSYQEHHIKKQYSETSIPSTNADPLSNSPTPPLRSHRKSRLENKLENNFAENNQKTNNSNFYYKLNDDVKVPRKYPTIKDKYTTSDYKQYAQNFGFGQQFLPFENETKQDKIEKAKKRQEYSRQIKEQNSLRNSNNNVKSRAAVNNNPNVNNNISNNKQISEFDATRRNGNFKYT